MAGEIKKESDLLKRLHDAEERLRQFRFGVSGSKTKNTKEGKNLKREIARILTELRSAHHGN